MCLLREEISLRKCFKYLEFGRVAKISSSLHNISTLCRKSGGAGHFVKHCEQNPNFNHCQAALDLFSQSIYENKIDVADVCEQYKELHFGL